MFFVVLVLNVTGLFSFVAPPLGVSIGQVSLVLLGISLLYLVSKARDSATILLRGGVGGWLFLLLIWPLGTVLYAPALEARDVGLQLYFFTLFLGAIVYASTNGLVAMRRVLSLSLAITIVGLVLSMLAPTYFAGVAELAGATDYPKEVRATGFFLQPNSLALNMGFLFIGWAALGRRKNALLEVAAILGIVVAMLLTGSRTGVLVVVIVSALTMMSWLRKGMASGRFLLKVGLLVLGLVVGAIGMEYYMSQTETHGLPRDDLIGRIRLLYELKLSEGQSFFQDKSVQQRLGAQAVYWQLIKQKPLLGHGLGSETYYLENGPIRLTAHSDAIALAMKYGVLYPVVFVLLLLLLYKRRARRGVSGTFHTSSVGQFVVVSALLFAISTIADLHVFYVVLGMFFAAVRYPEQGDAVLAASTRAAETALRRGIAT
jgi:O-antigen ligase